jgi:hypothetical protein
MTIHQFEALALQDRSKILWEHGELVGDKIDNTHIISIYKLFSFLVEVYCDKEFTMIEDILPAQY